jgi:chemotaxis protein CheD
VSEVDRIVGISEHMVSTDPAEVLVTYSLGSCVGLVLHDPVAGVAGMLHSMMPASKSNPEKAAGNPSMYTDTGATALIRDMFAAGATRANLVAKVVGAASQVDNAQMFRIGERNYAVVRKVLWKNDILIAAEDVGGAVSRTVYLEVGTGRTTVRSEGALTEI